jgi:hypothetical protein
MAEKRKWDADFPHNGNKINSLHSSHLSTLLVEKTHKHIQRNEKATPKCFKEMKQEQNT